jgi:hypothetical protein
MSALPGHPFDLGPGWDAALHDRPVDLDELLSTWVASADWPASMFWREALAASPDAVVVLSVRDSAQTWWESLSSTVLHVMRGEVPDSPNHLRDLLERFAGPDWTDRATMTTAYDSHNDAVRREVPPGRLVEWEPRDGWEPLAAAVGAAVPDAPFPWSNRREDWRD